MNDINNINKGLEYQTFLSLLRKMHTHILYAYAKRTYQELIGQEKYLYLDTKYLSLPKTFDSLKYICFVDTNEKKKKIESAEVKFYQNGDCVIYIYVEDMNPNDFGELSDFIKTSEFITILAHEFIHYIDYVNGVIDIDEVDNEIYAYCNGINEIRAYYGEALFTQCYEFYKGKYDDVESFVEDSYINYMDKSYLKICDADVNYTIDYNIREFAEVFLHMYNKNIFTRVYAKYFM